MIIYKVIDEFSRETGKKIGQRKVEDYRICDFSGKRMDQFYGYPISYTIDYNDVDPCFGDQEAERWLYEWNENADVYVDAYELFSQPEYNFGTNDDGTEVFTELLATAKKEKFEIVSLDHLLRWSRGRMLEKLIKEKKIDIDKLIE